MAANPSNKQITSMVRNYHSLKISMGTYGQDRGPVHSQIRYYTSKKRALDARKELLADHKEYDGVIRPIANADVDILLSNPNAFEDNFDPLTIAGFVVLTRPISQCEVDVTVFYVNLAEMDKCHSLVSEMVKDDINWSVSVRKVIMDDNKHSIITVEEVMDGVKKALKI